MVPLINICIHFNLFN